MVPESSVWLKNFISGQTRRSYQTAIKDFAVFIGIESEYDLKKINQAHVIAWRDDKLKNGASNRTINAGLSAVSSLFKHLCEKQVVEKNPVDGVKRSRITKDQVEAQALTAHQVRKILDAPGKKTLKELRDAVILHILFYSGCRIAEVCKLKVKDYLIDSGYRVLNFTLKGGRQNKVAIHPELKLILNKYLKKAGHGEEPESPLILATKRAELRRHLDPAHINRIFHQYARKAKLPKGVTPHSARATFITEALDMKCPIETVQRTVGHARISTTQMYDKRSIKHRESASLSMRF